MQTLATPSSWFCSSWWPPLSPVSYSPSREQGPNRPGGGEQQLSKKLGKETYTSCEGPFIDDVTHIWSFLIPTPHCHVVPKSLNSHIYINRVRLKHHLLKILPVIIPFRYANPSKFYILSLGFPDIKMKQGFIIGVYIFVFKFEQSSYLFSLNNSCPCRDLKPGTPRYQADMLPIKLCWLGSQLPHNYFVCKQHRQDTWSRFRV